MTESAEPPTSRPTHRSAVRRLLHWLLKALGIFLVASVVLTAIYTIVPPPMTPLMVIRLFQGEGLSKDWTAYDRISPNLVSAVIAAEDAKFCSHYGFDWPAIQKAWSRNQNSTRIKGGSTISNQTAKNVFLWPDRTYLRKGLEFYFTGLIELFWSKKRVIEVYLNVVEFGHGVYGAEAAAQAHFGKTAATLSKREAALLAAVLPNPRCWSASKPTAYIRGRASTIQARMNDVPDPTGDPCARIPTGE